jgi:hypothetical protein
MTDQPFGKGAGRSLLTTAARRTGRSVEKVSGRESG